MKDWNWTAVLAIYAVTIIALVYLALRTSGCV